MTARIAYPALGALAVVVVGVLGFTVGPMAALAAVGAVVAVAAGALVTSGLGRGEGRAPPAAEVEAPVEDDAPFYRGLAWVVALAVAVRLLMVAVLNTTSLWSSFAPDSAYWMFSGEALLAHWSDPAVPLSPWFGTEEARPFYAVFNALVASVLGPTRWGPSLINGLVSIWAAFNFGRLADLMYGRAAARRTFILGLFFPSVVLWSSMNIREAWSFLVISFTLLAAHRLRMRFSPTDLVLLIGSIGAMYFIRSYLVPLIFLGVVLSYLVVRLRQLPYALVSLVLILFVAQSVGPDFGLDPALFSEDSLETVDEMRRGLAFGGSAYGGDADTSTLSSSIAYLPEGVARFLLGPFPWAVQSWRQILTVPESLLWYWLLGLAIWSLSSDLRRNLVKVAPSFFVLVLITAAYGLVSGNEGTAYRHRAQVMVIVFVFASSRPLFGGRRG